MGFLEGQRDPPLQSGRRSRQMRPWERNDGVKAENWNQRAYTSPVSSEVV
jgi:hypothetical protein